MTSEILTMFEASKLLKVSERTLWQLVKDKAISYFRVGRQYRFLASAIKEWAVSQSPI